MSVGEWFVFLTFGIPLVVLALMSLLGVILFAWHWSKQKVRDWRHEW